eukprot:1986403-Rhodomonas_salina.2
MAVPDPIVCPFIAGRPPQTTSVHPIPTMSADACSPPGSCLRTRCAMPAPSLPTDAHSKPRVTSRTYLCVRLAVMSGSETANGAARAELQTELFLKREVSSGIGLRACYGRDMGVLRGVRY